MALLEERPSSIYLEKNYFNVSHRRRKTHSIEFIWSLLFNWFSYSKEFERLIEEKTSEDISLVRPSGRRKARVLYSLLHEGCHRHTQLDQCPSRSWHPSGRVSGRNQPEHCEIYPFERSQDKQWSHRHDLCGVPIGENRKSRVKHV